MSDMFYPVFTVFSGIAVVLAVVPLPWHFNSWNSGTCFYMLWAALASSNMFVNSIVWHKNAIDWAPVWCDISSRIIVASSIGIPASALCITRRLYNISRVNAVTITKQDKRRAALMDAILCVAFPLLEVVLYFVVEGHRYDIFEDIGCFPVVINTWVAIVLVQIWPIVMGIVSAVYCVLSLRAFLKRQSSFQEFLSSHSAITPGRYLRLMALAMTEVLCNVPLNSYSLYLNYSEGLARYVSWSDLHWGFSHIRQFPAVIWQIDHRRVIGMELARWAPVACAIIFFLFFGFAGEARKHYKMAYVAIAKLFGYKSPSSTGSNVPSTGSRGLPLYMPPPPNIRKRPDSFASSFTGTIAAPAYSPRTSFEDVKQLTIDTKKRAHVPPASFSPTADELVMITHMLRISDPTDALHPPEPAMLRGSTTYSDYTLEAVTIRTPTTFTYDISPPTTPTLVVDTPSTSTYTIPSPSSSMHPTFHPSPPASPTWPRDNYSTAV